MEVVKEGSVPPVKRCQVLLFSAVQMIWLQHLTELNWESFTFLNNRARVFADLGRYRRIGLHLLLIGCLHVQIVASNFTVH